MTDKQRQFADEYLKDCNATRAYKTAYPEIKNDHTAASAGSRLLRNVDIRAYIEKTLEEISSDSIASTTEQLQYLTAVMRGEEKSEKVVIIKTGYGISEAKLIKVAPEERTRLKAAELLCRTYGMFNSKIVLQQEAPVQIIDDITDL